MRLAPLSGHSVPEPEFVFTQRYGCAGEEGTGHHRPTLGAQTARPYTLEPAPGGVGGPVEVERPLHADGSVHPADALVPEPQQHPKRVGEQEVRIALRLHEEIAVEGPAGHRARGEKRRPKAPVRAELREERQRGGDLGDRCGMVRARGVQRRQDLAVLSSHENPVVGPYLLASQRLKRQLGRGCQRSQEVNSQECEPDESVHGFRKSRWDGATTVRRITRPCNAHNVDGMKPVDSARPERSEAKSKDATQGRVTLQP